MLCFLWYLFMPTTLACSSDMLVGPNCTPCADGFEPTVMHDGCVSCAADSAGTQGRCERCEDGFEPNAGPTACEKTLLSLMETIWLPLLGVTVSLLTAGFCTCGAEKQARGYTQQVNEDEDDMEVGTPKLRRRSPSLPLPPIVSRKLDRPGEPLCADESIECLVSCINYGAAQAASPPPPSHPPPPSLPPSSPPSPSPSPPSPPLQFRHPRPRRRSERSSKS